MVLLSEKLQGGLTGRPPTPSPGALPASSRGGEKDQGLPPIRSFLPHAGLPHYSPLWPIIRGESHAAHTLSILLLNSMNWSAAKGMFLCKNPAALTSIRRTNCPSSCCKESCLVADTDLWHKETIYSSCRGHKNPCNKKNTTVWLVFMGPLPGKLLGFWQKLLGGLFPSLATIAKRGYKSARW